MNARRILLVESLEAAGATARDARTRARILLAAGWESRAAVVESAVTELLHAPPADGDVFHVRADARGRDALRAWIGICQADAVLVASALPGGGTVGRWLADLPGARAWWWPSGIGPRTWREAAPEGAAPAGEGGLLPLPWETGAIEEPWPGACDGIEASVPGEERLARGSLPLWDGEYVLVPAPLSGAAGAAALAAFASLCETHDGLDLVVLADPQAEFEALARARGVGFRVHFAGPAPRDAELAWLDAAGAALIAGDAPVSGGLVLRALACGCPLLAAPGAPSGPALEAWLAARGLACGDARVPLAARLERALQRGSAWAARTPPVLARHRVEPVAERLARALAAAMAARRAA